MKFCINPELLTLIESLHERVEDKWAWSYEHVPLNDTLDRRILHRIRAAK